MALLIVGPGNTVQNVVNEARPGDLILILIRSSEIVTVNTNTLRIAGGQVGGFRINADSVTISGTEIEGAGTGTGIELNGSNGSIIATEIEDVDLGLRITGNQNLVMNNEVDANGIGIQLTADAVRNAVLRNEIDAPVRIDAEPPADQQNVIIFNE